MNKLELLEDELHCLGVEKFEYEARIESIQHQLEMSLLRKGMGEVVNYEWVNKARYKLNMLKIEVKKINLEFDSTKKKIDRIHRQERANFQVRTERIFMDLIKEHYGNEVFFTILDEAKRKINEIDGGEYTCY